MQEWASLEVTMRAMVYRGPYRVRVEEKDVPAIEHPNDAIVRVTRAAICESDLHLYHGMMPDTRVGMTFGHEFIGVVHEVGSSVQSLPATGSWCRSTCSAGPATSAPAGSTPTATT
jgi:threonine dehydrogenase-like Zn-dependent dehydrogenase